MSYPHLQEMRGRREARDEEEEEEEEEGGKRGESKSDTVGALKAMEKKIN
jgi:hypothetical protein